MVVEGSEVKDSRFSAQHADPRFQPVPKDKRKVKIDDRFKAMLDQSGSFSRKAVSDKYGRKIKHQMKEDLSKFYDLDEEEAEGAEEVSEPKVKPKTKKGDGSKEQKRGKALKAKAPEEKPKTKLKKKKAQEDEGSKIKPKKKKAKESSSLGFDRVAMKLKSQNLREAMMDWTSSSSDSESEEDIGEVPDEAIDVAAPILPVTNQIKSGQETRRLAAVNMDWQRITATDLLILLRSFAPSTGEVLKVTIYPSQFGKERMEEERTRGPGRFLGLEGGKEPAGVGADEEEGEESEEKAEVDLAKLRKYEAEKLMYYYAVVECDSVRTATVIYGQCDGVEYEASSNVMDLRYIPDEETFFEEPHSSASEVPKDYDSPFFTNYAIGHTSVKSTWDSDDPKRELLHGKGLSGGKGKRSKREKEMQMIDYSAFLATSDEEEEVDEEAEQKREKARALLLGSGKSADAFGAKPEHDQDMDMVVTFQPGISDVGERMLRRKKEKEEEEGLTVWEKYQRKRAEKKAGKREAREAKGQGGSGGRPDLDDEDVPHDSEFVDDSVFEDDPFFQLPDEEEKPKGMWKKKKGARGQEEMGREAEEAERKEKELEQLKLLMMDEEGTNKRGYSIKPTALGRASERAGEAERRKKKKGKGKGKSEEGQEDDFEVNVKDDRFVSVFSDPRFALDPTDPQFSKSPGLRKLLDEGRERRKDEPKRKAASAIAEQKEVKKSKISDPALASLVSTLKSRKAKA